MVRNKEKYEKALSLRKRGFTLKEIAKYCDISKSTASEWLKNKAFSAQVTQQNTRRAGIENGKRLKLVNKARASERVIRYEEIIRGAEIEYKHYKKDTLFMSGLTLYMCSGDLKDERRIRLSTTSMSLHKIFKRFSEEYLGVDKRQIHFWLLLYPSLNEEVCMKKWTKVTGIPYSQYYKNHVIKNPSTAKPLHNGVGNTIIASTALKCKLNRWIQLAIAELSV